MYGFTDDLQRPSFGLEYAKRNQTTQSFNHTLSVPMISLNIDDPMNTLLFNKTAYAMSIKPKAKSEFMSHSIDCQARGKFFNKCPRNEIKKLSRILSYKTETDTECSSSQQSFII